LNFFSQIESVHQLCVEQASTATSLIKVIWDKVDRFKDKEYEMYCLARTAAVLVKPLEAVLQGVACAPLEQQQILRSGLDELLTSLWELDALATKISDMKLVVRFLSSSKIREQMQRVQEELKYFWHLLENLSTLVAAARQIDQQIQSATTTALF
jgi:hypothetical protein